MIVHEAATAAVTLIDTAILWVQTLAAAASFVLCVVAFAVGPLVAPAVMAARRAVTRPSWARGPLHARIHAAHRAQRP